jgi:hypothetical protein
MSEEEALEITRVPLDIGSLIVSPDTPIQQWPTTLPLTETGRKMLLNAMGSSDIEPGRDGIVMMEIAHILAFPREEVDEQTGMVRRYSWLVLIDPEGHTWGTSSPAVADQVRRIFGAVAAGWLDWPVAVKINTRYPMKDGRMRHDLKVM